MGNAIRSPNNCTAIILLIDQLFYNLGFDIFAIAVLAVWCMIITVALARHRRGSKDIAVYITGAFIVFSALEYRYISKIIGSDTAIHNIQVTNKIAQTVNGAKSYIMGAIGAYLSAGLLGNNLRADGASIKGNFLVEGERLTEIESQRALAIHFAKGKTPSDGEVTQHRSKDRKTGNKLKNGDAEKRSGAMEVSKSKKQVNSSSRIHKDTRKKATSALETSKAKTDGTPKNTAINNPEVNLVAAPYNSSKSALGLGLSADRFISIPCATCTSGTSENDAYLQHVISIFNREFALNNKISACFNSVLESKKRILSELEAFNEYFKRFYTSAMEIEKEMASFNANPRYFQYEVSDLSSSLKEALAVTSVLDNLNYRNGTDAALNRIFRAESNRQRISFQRIEVIRSHFWLRCMQWCAAGQILFGFSLLVVILYEIDFLLILIICALAILFINALFSMYVMALAQSLDKLCLVGNIDGCRGRYTDGFAQFAATADLDLSRKGQALQIGDALNKIEVRTAKVVEVLKTYIQNNPTGRFEYRTMVVQNLFDKIFFVRDDFEKLTDGRADKDAFYKSLDAMDQLIHKMKNNVETLKGENLLDFYTREVLFLNFIHGEKARILRYVSDQFNSNETGIINTGEHKSCEIKRSRICYSKILADRLSVLMLFGSIILGALYCI